MWVDALAILCVELLFTLLPFVVYGIIYAINNTSSKVFQLPGWGMAASIIFGKTIVRFVSTIISKGVSAAAERVVLIITLLLVFGIVPSLLIVFFMVTTGSPSDVLVLAQIVIFVVAIIIFFFFGIDLSTSESK